MDEAAHAQRVAALARELTEARGRGLERLDRPLGDHGPLALPILTELARRHGGGSPGLDRGPSIRRLMVDALDEWETTAGREEPAALVRALFGLDRAGPLPSPQTLLTAARDKWKITDPDAFHDLQHEDFKLFAAWLIEFVEGPAPAEEPPGTVVDQMTLVPPEPPRTAESQTVEPPPVLVTQPRPVEPPVVTQGQAAPVVAPVAGARARPGWLSWPLAVVALIAVAALVVSLVVVLGRHNAAGTGASGGSGSSGGTSSTGAGVSIGGGNGTSTASGGALFTFDALGGNQPIIRVFPGVHDTAQDLGQNGTFRDGDQVEALCKTTGRMVSTDPSSGEPAGRHSNIWLRIRGTAGVTQYARLLYGRIDMRALAHLPACTGVP